MKKIISIYIVISVFSGVYFYGASKYKCFNSVGFVKSFFIGCNSLSENIMLHGESVLLKSGLKGIAWPYFLFVNKANARSYSIEDIAAAIIYEENKKSGNKIGQALTFNYAYLKNKIIVLSYLVDGRTIDAMKQPYNKKVVYDNNVNSFCKNDGSISYKYIKILLNNGYKFKMLFKAPQEKLSFIITKCP